MHELSVTDSILNIVLTHARDQRASHVHRVLLVVSELSDLQPLWLQKYFTQLAAGSIAAGARLEVETSAPEFRCNACGEDFALSLRSVDRVRCPTCDATDCTMTTTPDYFLEEIEVS